MFRGIKIRNIDDLLEANLDWGTLDTKPGNKD